MSGEDKELEEKLMRGAAEKLITNDYTAVLVVFYDANQGVTTYQTGGRLVALGLAEHARQAFGPVPFWKMDND